MCYRITRWSNCIYCPRKSFVRVVEKSQNSESNDTSWKLCDRFVLRKDSSSPWSCRSDLAETTLSFTTVDLLAFVLGTRVNKTSSLGIASCQTKSIKMLSISITSCQAKSFEQISILVLFFAASAKFRGSLVNSAGHGYSPQRLDNAPHFGPPEPAPSTAPGGRPTMLSPPEDDDVPIIHVGDPNSPLRDMTDKELRRYLDALICTLIFLFIFIVSMCSNMFCCGTRMICICVSCAACRPGRHTPDVEGD